MTIYFDLLLFLDSHEDNLNSIVTLKIKYLVSSLNLFFPQEEYYPVTF